MTSLIIDGVTLSDEATLDAIQSYEKTRGGRTLLRMRDGTLRIQRHWSKDRITVRCGGWLPPDISAIDWDKDPMSITLIDLENDGDPVVHSVICVEEPKQDWNLRTPGGGLAAWMVVFEVI